MFRVLRLLIVAVIGAGLGLGSVQLVLTDPRFLRAAAIGPWRVATTDTSDPYAAARAARAAVVPLGAAEGVAFEATTDDAGRPLDPTCHTLVEGPIPDGVLWTLVVTDRAGRPPVNPAGRIGFTGRDVVRRADGTVAITVGRTVRPGNFVALGDLASVVLTLRVYSSRLAGDLPVAGELPSVRRVDCTTEASDG